MVSAGAEGVVCGRGGISVYYLITLPFQVWLPKREQNESTAPNSITELRIYQTSCISFFGGYLVLQ